MTDGRPAALCHSGTATVAQWDSPSDVTLLFKCDAYQLHDYRVHDACQLHTKVPASSCVLRICTACMHLSCINSTPPTSLLQALMVPEPCHHLHDQRAGWRHHVNSAYERHFISPLLHKRGLPCLASAVPRPGTMLGRDSGQTRAHSLQDFIWSDVIIDPMVHEASMLASASAPSSNLLGLAAFCRRQSIQSCRACHQAHSDRLQQGSACQPHHGGPARYLL